MHLMETLRTTPPGEAPPASGHWDALINWLAVVMLLAGSVVWTR